MKKVLTKFKKLFKKVVIIYCKEAAQRFVFIKKSCGFLSNSMKYHKKKNKYKKLEI